MAETLNQKFGISSRVQLLEISESHIGIIKQIKSRIIQKDVLKIIEFAAAIKNYDASLEVSLICNDNICSKSVKLLQVNNISIQFVN